jgi:hypothetical protein
MPKNTMNDLRNHLFAALESLGDPEEGKDLEKEIARAKAICDVSQTIINGVKVELDYRELTGEFTDADNFFGKPNLNPERILDAGSRLGRDLALRAKGPQ